jgi:exosortase/archaeosortase family protein
VIVTGIGTHAEIGLQITNECTVELLVVPMLFLAGLIILFRRFSVIGIALGLLLGVAVVIATNQIRIILIAYATIVFGQNVGYELTHKFIGSLVAIGGFSAGLLIMMRVVPRLINQSRK